MTDLNQFLTSLREPGELESAGEFTVSRATAESKMERFQLAVPELYIVQFVASAVASGANFLRIDTNLSQLEFVSDGVSPNEEQLNDIFVHLFNTVDSPAYLSELAVGLQAALNLPCKRVLIESYTQKGAWRLELRPSKQRLTPLTKTPPVTPLTRIVVDKGFGLRTRLTDRHTEHKYLPACQFAPLDLFFDGEAQTVESGTLPESSLAWCQITSQGSSLPGSQGQPVHTVERPGVRGWLALTRPDVAGDHGLRIIFNGVLFQRTSKKMLGLTNMCGLVQVDKLRKNISHTDLAEDSDFGALYRFLNQTGIEFLAKLCEESKELKADRYLLRMAVHQMKKRSDVGAQYRGEFDHWLALDSLDSVEDVGQFMATLQKAEQLTESGHQEEAQDLREGVKNAVRLKVLELFQMAPWQKVLELLEPLERALRDAGSPALQVFLQGRNLLLAYLHQEEADPEAFESVSGWGLHRRALLYRWQKNRVEAAEWHALVLEQDQSAVAGWAYRFCAEIELAQGGYETADEMMSKAQSLLTNSRDLKEERAFLKRLVSDMGRGQSVKILSECVVSAEKDPYVNWLMLSWLVKEGRGILPLDQWVKLRAQASFAELKGKLMFGLRKPVEDRLCGQFDLLGWKSLEEARLEKVEAVQAAEESFGRTHPYTQYSRRRAVYQLHRLEDHERAEELQCAGHLLAQFERCLQEL